MSVLRLVLGLAVTVSVAGLVHSAKAEGVGFLGVILEPDQKAVVVIGIAQDSPADKAGVKLGDVIVKLDGNAAGTPEDFSKALRARKPGETVSLEITRGTEAVTIKVKLGERP